MIEIETLSIDESSVAAYLRDNPDFFDRYPNVLAELRLPHQSGQAVSLIERQISALRGRNSDMRKQLKVLLNAANDNDELFQKITVLTLALLDSGTFTEIDGVLADKLASQFAADHVMCYVSRDQASVTAYSGDQVTFQETLPAVSLMRNGHTTEVSCGPVRAEEYCALFPYATPANGSVVIAPMVVSSTSGDWQAMLAIGSIDPDRYSTDLGTLFIEFVSSVLSRVLGRLL